MEKKNLKWYVTPEMEVIDMELESACLLEGSIDQPEDGE
jgi:hypothetical protein